MIRYSQRQLTIFSLTTLCAGLWAPLSLAQTSPTTTFDQKTVDIFDSTEGSSFNPLDIIHQANFSREDPFSFFQRQQENLNSEFSDFRSRQLEQLREEGYQPPSLAVDGDTEARIEAETEAETIAPALNPEETSSDSILRLELPEESSGTLE